MKLTYDIEDSSLKTNCDLRQFTTSPIEINVRSSDEDGWRVEKSFSLELLNIIMAIALSDLSTEVIVYPNPAIESINFENLSANEAKVVIMSMDGRVVHECMMDPENSSLSVGSLPRGIYHVSAETIKGIVNTRILLLN